MLVPPPPVPAWTITSLQAADEPAGLQQQDASQRDAPQQAAAQQVPAQQVPAQHQQQQQQQQQQTHTLQQQVLSLTEDRGRLMTRLGDAAAALAATRRTEQERTSRCAPPLQVLMCPLKLFCIATRTKAILCNTAIIVCMHRCREALKLLQQVCNIAEAQMDS